MRTFDLSPLYKTTVGFDRLASLLDQGTFETANGYPPYNIERLGENDYRITMAVSGFSGDELEIESKEDVLSVSGKKAEESTDRNFLYQGIAARSFERRFRLADHVKVASASLENGLLNIDLVREIPEEMKPRKIAINTRKAKVIETKAA
jgi:molecular chaperone IbpA